MNMHIFYEYIWKRVILNSTNKPQFG